MKKNILTLVVLALLVLSGSVSAQISPTISVQGTNATLRWTSNPGESYVVLYRRAFHDAFPWVVLNASVSASGGIETFFQHSGGVPRVPAGVGGGGGGGGGTPGSPSVAMVAAPSGDPEKAKKEKDKKQDGGLPAFPDLPDEKAIEKWLKEMLKEYERMQREGSGSPPVMVLMASSLTAEEATNNSMGFYIVLNAADDLNGDGVPDGVAAQHGVNPLNDLTQTDTDGDGLTDGQEIALGTDPTKIDTDGDGASDAEEVSAGSDPKIPHGLPGITAAFYEEAFDQVNDGVNGGYHYLYRQEWGTRLYESSRTVYAQPSNGEVGTTTVTEWPMQFAQVMNGTTTSWTDLVGGGRANITVTTNVAPPIPMRPYNGYWKQGTTDGTRFQTVLQVTTLGTNQSLLRAYQFEFSANIGGTPVETLTGITINGEVLTTNGICWLVLPEGVRTNLTVSFPIVYNPAIEFTASHSPLKVPISLRVDGAVTNSSETGGFGPDPDTYYWLLALAGTNLGVVPNPQGGASLQYLNLAELVATVPGDERFYGGLKWHRDANAKKFWYVPSPLEDAPKAPGERIFTGAPPGPGNDSTSVELGPVDTLPDSANQIHDYDGPSVSPTSIFDAELPVGGMKVLRFYAHQWVSWRGGVASDIVHWYSKVTLKKIYKDPLGVLPDIWIRVGPNEIGYTPFDPAPTYEIPFFTIEEAQQY